MASAGGDSGETLSLNIMPMLDIFSILLTFLLMSYSTDPVNHDINENLELPDSVTLVSMDEVPSIIVAREEVYVNDNKIIDLVNGKVKEEDLQQGAVFPVYEELKKLSEQNKAVAREVISSPDEKKVDPGSITIEMDRKHNFELLRRLMISGQQAEFIKFKLLVAKENID